jgi:hypothetical protein
MKTVNWPARAGLAAYLQQYPVLFSGVAWWHLLLGTIALINVALWSLSAAAVTGAEALGHSGATAAWHLQLLLSAAYMLGCAYRSVFLVFDIPRTVLIDSRLSNVVVGRSVATLAELCFATQWALMLHRAALLSGSVFGVEVSLAIVPIIVLAEVVSWHSVLTTDQRGHMAENSLWGITAILVVASMLVIGPDRLAHLYPGLIAWCVGGVAYALFIFFFDVPMYWSRWRADERNGRRYLTLAQGFREVYQRRVVSYRWQTWKGEVLWMTLYFSLGVWSSISLVYAAIAFS